MLRNYNTYRVLKLFFDRPTHNFQLREISRDLKLGLPSVKNHLEKLKKLGFIKKEKKGVYKSYVSTRNDLFKLYKKTDILIRLYKSGLVDFLADTISPDSIVLFGSASRGEDIETSDIDLLVVANERQVNLKVFEKKLKRKIALHFEPRVEKIPKELLNNIINGIVIYGYLKVF